MDDDTTLINPSTPKVSAPISKKNTHLNDFTRVTSNLFKAKDKDNQTQKIKLDLIQSYIDQSDLKSISTFQKILHFFKTKK
jgi:hypothetical protein